MIDREKVIKGLIACTSDDSQAEDEWHDCENWPYCDICATGNTGIGIPVMLDALALLKEQDSEIVRCRDCRFFDIYAGCGKYLIHSGTDRFCADGRRRDES